MCASAGIPILPDGAPDNDDREYVLGDFSEVDYQDLFEDDSQGVPMFPENDIWPTTAGGLPLTKRYLELLPGSDETESDQYFHVIKHWTKEDESSSVEAGSYQVEPIVQPAKRRYQLVDHDDETSSELSRAATEPVGKRRCQTVWKELAVVGGSRK